MHIRDHGPNVPSGVRRTSLRILDRVQVVGHRRIKIHRVSFVEGVNFATRRYFYLGEIRLGTLWVLDRRSFLTSG